MKKYLEGLAENSYHVRFLAWLLVFNFVDLLVLLAPIRINRSSPRKVVFTRLDSIGDYLIWTSSFPSIEEMYPSPSYEVIFVGNKSCQDFADRSPIFRERLYLDRKRLVVDPIYRFRMMRQVRKLNAEIVINPTLSRDFLWSDSIVRCSAASEKIGSCGIANRMTWLQRKICDGWYTRLIDPPKPNQHEVISNRDFLEQLSPNGSRTDLIPLPSVPAAEGPSHFELKSPFAVFFLGAQFGYKRWPVDRFAEVARCVAESYALNIVICGGPAEERIAQDFGAAFGEDFVDLVGKTSLSELSEVIAKARLVISNDTSVCHIAVAVGCPVVVVNSGAHVGRFFPYPAKSMARPISQISLVSEMPCFGCDWNCVYSELGRDEPKPCITGISVEQATDAIHKILAGETSRHK